MSTLIIRLFIRRLKFNMICMISNIYRKMTNMRIRESVKYVQAAITVILLAYLGSVHLQGFSPTVSEKKSNLFEDSADQFPRLAKPRPKMPAYTNDKESFQSLQLQGSAKPGPDVDENVFRRIDTTPEFTQKLPFESNYKSPCWHELDDLLTPVVKLRCLPYFYVVGVSGCGTKHLFDKLTIHPLISENVKAGNRWFTRLRFAGYPYLSDYLQFYYRAVKTDIERIKTMDGYHNAIFGDFTPSTFWDNHLLNREAKKMNVSDPPYTNADVINHLNPNARIIVLLCDPVERLFTDYLSISEENEASPYTGQFHEHVVNALDRFNTCLTNRTFLRCVYFGKPLSSYYTAGLSRLEIGLYKVHLDNFLTTFPKEQILIIKKETLDTNPAKVLEDIFRFLDVGNITDPIIWNHLTMVRSQTLVRPIGDMRPETRKLIQDFYTPFNKQLAQFLGPEFDYNINYNKNK